MSTSIENGKIERAIPLVIQGLIGILLSIVAWTFSNFATEVRGSIADLRLEVRSAVTELRSHLNDAERTLAAHDAKIENLERSERKR